jgi:hypothetical protein
MAEFQAIRTLQGHPEAPRFLQRDEGSPLHYRVAIKLTHEQTILMFTLTWRLLSFKFPCFPSQ